MLHIPRSLLSAMLIAACTHAVAQAPASPNDVLAENKWAKVTRGDYEIELQRLPPDVRGGFGTNPKRVTDLIARLLLSKSLAAQARAEGLDKDALAQQRLALEMDKLVAGLYIAKVEEDAGKTFDAKLPQFEAKAKELYLVDRQKYATPEQVSAAHILFDFKKHSKEEGLELARKTKAKIAAGADFGALAKEVSDDPTAAKNAGSIGYFAKSQMDPAFSNAAFALKNVGDVSEPVLSSFGWHIIKLEGRRPAAQQSFDEVKQSIVAEQRKKYIDEQRDAAVRATSSDPSTKSNQAAIDSLVVRIDPELARRLTIPSAPETPSK
jgi:peptidyl-prolyl cis-trans isomerase C